MLSDHKIKHMREEAEKGISCKSSDVIKLLDEISELRGKMLESNSLLLEVQPFVGQLIVDMHYLHILTPLRMKLEKYCLQIIAQDKTKKDLVV